MLEEKANREKLGAGSRELQSTFTKQPEEMKSTWESNDQLQKDQFDVLDVGDDAFDRAKAQVSCLHPDFYLCEMDFFKVVVDGRLMDMEETESSPADDLTQDDCADDTSLEVVDGDKNEE